MCIPNRVEKLAAEWETGSDCVGMILMIQEVSSKPAKTPLALAVGSETVSAIRNQGSVEHHCQRQ